MYLIHAIIKISEKLTTLSSLAGQRGCFDHGHKLDQRSGQVKLCVIQVKKNDRMCTKGVRYNFMAKKKHLKVLFIGNSHTYYHDLPAWVALMAREEGYECDVTMLAHGGWYLRQHVKEPDVRFNIKYGHYDYVVLQEHSHPFDDIPGYIEAATTLSGWIREAGSKPVIYGTWARKTEKNVQETMNNVNRKLAQDLGALYASVGESWWRYKESWPEIEMYDEDGAHASERGIEFAAKIIWVTIETDWGR